MNGFDEPKAKKPRISNYSTNWCDLPMEMRVECIKRMNFKTKYLFTSSFFENRMNYCRTCLGATSHTEKALVDAMKHHFDYAELVLGLGSSSSFECRTKNDIFFKLSMSIELTSVVKILKDCEIDTFVFKGHSIGSERPQFWSNIKKCAPFRFKKFVWQGDYDDSLLTFLKNIEDNEEIELRYYQRVKLTDLMAIQAVRNTKRLTTSIYGCDINEFHTIVQVCFLNSLFNSTQLNFFMIITGQSLLKSKRSCLQL